MVFYKIIISVYYFIIYFLQLVGNSKAKQYINGRKNIFNNSLLNFSKINRPCIWIHCASMGEYQDVSAFYQLCKMYLKNHKFIITFSSPSGFEYYKDKNIADAISYLPFENKNSVLKFISLVKPEKVIISRNDLWPVLIQELNKQAVPVYLIDYCFNSKIILLPFIKQFYNSVFEKINLILCQNEKTKSILKNNFAIEKIISTGNTRYDCQIDQSQLRDVFLKKFTCQFTIIFGSITEKDIFLFNSTYHKFKGRAKFIVVCHEPSPKFYDRFFKITKGDIIKWSERKESVNDVSTLYVDKVGILKDLYFYSNFAYIGGGFNFKAIHNILEPASAGNYVLFGPNHRNYTEVVYLLKNGDCSIINNSDDIISIIENNIENFKVSVKNSEAIKQAKGASYNNFNLIFKDVIGDVS